MAISRNNVLLSNASGMIGGQIVLKKYYDKTVISKMPDMSRRKLSEKQIEANDRMRNANMYARYLYSTEERKLQSRLRLKLPAHKSLYHGLVKEYLVKYPDLPVLTAVKKQLNRRHKAQGVRNKSCLFYITTVYTMALSRSLCLVPCALCLVSYALFSP